MQKESIMNVGRDWLDTYEKRSKYTICIVGGRKYGLLIAYLFAEAGYKVIGTDRNFKVLDSILKKKGIFYDSELENKLKKLVKKKKVMLTDNIFHAVSQSDIIVSIGTVPIDGKLKLDYSRLELKFREIGKSLQRGSIIIVADEVVPGTTEGLIKETLENTSGFKAGSDFGLAFSTIGISSSIVKNGVVYKPIVAGIDERSLEVASSILQTLSKGKVISVNSIRTAEAVRLFYNVYRDVNIALSNELALFCEKIGADYSEVIQAVKNAFGTRLLYPQLVGDHASREVHLLLNEADILGINLKMAKTARKVNEAMVKRVLELIRTALKKCGKPLRGAKIAILGISIKEDAKKNNSKIAEALKKLEAKGARIKVYDPYFSKRELKELGYPGESSIENAVKGADCLLLTVKHKQFRKLNFRKIKTLTKSPLAIVDLVNVINSQEIKDEIVYIGLGKPMKM